VVRPQDHQYRLPAPKFTRPAVIASPPEPRSLHRYGDLTDAPIVTICTIAAQVWPTPVNRRHIRDRGLRKMADYLTRYPGNSWQERWNASPLATTTIGDAVGDGRAIRSEFTQAAQAGSRCGSSARHSPRSEPTSSSTTRHNSSKQNTIRC
jgi:hypothetical protein